MDPDEFLGDSPLARSVFEMVRGSLSPFDDVAIRTTTSQIAFRRRRGFAYIWLPGMYLDRPHAEVVLSIALDRELDSPRFKEVAHPSAGIWQHHLEVQNADDLDDEVRDWLVAAYHRAGQGTEPFVPIDFSPPTQLDHPAFRLRPLGTEHNERDHAAWMSSIDHIRATPGYPDGRWPRPMSLEQNLADLQRHHDHFRDRVGFTYTVLEAHGPVDHADVIGCVYIYPDDQPDTDVHVQSWVREDRAALDPVLAATVRAWLEEAWPWDPDRIRDHPRNPAS